MKFLEMAVICMGPVDEDSRLIYVSVLEIGKGNSATNARNIILETIVRILSALQMGWRVLAMEIVHIQTLVPAPSVFTERVARPATLLNAKHSVQPLSLQLQLW